MLSREDNELLCRVGPGTPMGELMRQYWVPAVLSPASCPTPDCAPVRVRLLGENLIAFRATSGTVGLIQNHCPHRGASLFFGRNEEDGLRCVYHGWKFDVRRHLRRHADRAGREPTSRTRSGRVAYPCEERNGIIWTYMGPRPTPPPLPDLEPNMLPDGASRAQVYQRECNWLQALEGDIDTGHTVLPAPRRRDSRTTSRPGTLRRTTRVGDRAPRYEVVDTDVRRHVRRLPPRRAGQRTTGASPLPVPVLHDDSRRACSASQVLVRAWVPMDDEHTLAYTISLAGAARANRHVGRQVAGPVETLPNTSDWHGRFRPVPNSEQRLPDRPRRRRRRSATPASAASSSRTRR